MVLKLFKCFVAFVVIDLSSEALNESLGRPFAM